MAALEQPDIISLPAFNYTTSLRLDTTGNPEIRLLELQPSPSHTAPLQCRIFTTALSSPTPYLALSYFWGPNTQTHEVQVLPNNDGTPTTAIGITASLFSILHHFRLPTTPTTLWIDQVCINQSCPIDKAAQVSQMGTIYRRATQVLVWLGPARDDSDAVMDVLQEIGSSARDWGMEGYYTLARFGLLHAMSRNERPDDPDTKRLQEIMVHTAKRFAELVRSGNWAAWMRREWFTRVWTVQEFCMGADTVFVCGTRKVQAEVAMLGMRVFGFAVGMQYLSPADVGIERLMEATDDQVDKLFQVRGRRQRFQGKVDGATGDTLLVVLKKLFVGRDTRATMHRDRIFGLLGLAVDAERLGISPDYTLGFTDAMALTGAARAMIERGGRVDVLCYSQSPKAPDLEDLPSWVPDWRANIQPSYYNIIEPVDPHLFSASGDDGTVEVVPDSRPTSRTIKLSGYIVDVIQEVTGGAWFDNDGIYKSVAAKFLEFFDQFYDLWNRSLEKKDKIYGKKTEQTAENQETDKGLIKG
ncbi:heterokaryon incompatibility protein-domain-containing protein [Podospora conica]|nr:heterokaryon incompatibility protein-domain-containing protein [Schizothecium conicum]